MTRFTVALALGSLFVAACGDDPESRNIGSADSSYDVEFDVAPPDTATDTGTIEDSSIVVDSDIDSTVEDSGEPDTAMPDTAPVDTGVDTTPADTAECAAPTDCPGADTECATRTCVAGKCGVMNAAAGKVSTMQTAGDCKRNQCDGAGKMVAVADGADLPNDGSDCTLDTCEGSTPTFTQLSAGTPCSAGYCTLTGTCVQCLVASHCPGSDTACTRRACVSNMCSMTFAPSGTTAPTQVAGDCKRVVCNGSGGTTTVADTTDLPNDGNQCTNDTCSGSTPVHTFKGYSASCTLPGGGIGFCNTNAAGVPYCSPPIG